MLGMDCIPNWWTGENPHLELFHNFVVESSYCLHRHHPLLRVSQGINLHNKITLRSHHFVLCKSDGGRKWIHLLSVSAEDRVSCSTPWLEAGWCVLGFQKLSDAKGSPTRGGLGCLEPIPPGHPGGPAGVWLWPGGIVRSQHIVRFFQISWC